MDHNKYAAARRYVFKLHTFEHPLDLVHESYLIWNRRYGTDLFDQHISVIYSFLKRVHFTMYRNKFMYTLNGEKYRRSFIPVQEPEQEVQSYEPVNPFTPEHTLIHHEAEDRFRKVVRTLDRSENRITSQVYKLLSQGYSHIDIHKQTGYSKGSVTNSISAIRSALKPLQH